MTLVYKNNTRAHERNFSQFLYTQPAFYKPSHKAQKTLPCFEDLPVIEDKKKDIRFVYQKFDKSQKIFGETVKYNLKGIRRQLEKQRDEKLIEEGLKSEREISQIYQKNDFVRENDKADSQFRNTFSSGLSKQRKIKLHPYSNTERYQQKAQNVIQKKVIQLNNISRIILKDSISLYTKPRVKRNHNQKQMTVY